jgi:polyphenol oxidase
MTVFERAGRFEFLDLRSYFPPSVSAFLLIAKDERLSKEDIGEFLKKTGIPAETIHRPKQVHSGIIIEDCRENECDGVYTEKAREAITIAVADCVPIMISANNGEALITLHSGWKGTIGRIAEKAGSIITPKNWDRVWIGPSIRKCCYEVGEERIKAFREAFPGSAGIDYQNRRLDLPVINAGMCEKIGIPREKITMDGRCTSCSPEGFASYRRDGEKAGRMVLVAVRT